MVILDEEYYLPDIFKDVITRVNEFFENRATDPFTVTADHGIYEQVGNDKLKSGSGFLSAWLVMPFTETSPKDDSYAADVDCKIILSAKTEKNYTQLERETINFFPRLIPVFKRLIYELSVEPKLENTYKVDHSKRLLPYWGGGDVAAPGQPNLWKENADCIELSLKLKKALYKECTPLTNM